MEGKSSIENFAILVFYGSEFCELSKAKYRLNLQYQEKKVRKIIL